MEILIGNQKLELQWKHAISVGAAFITHFILLLLLLLLIAFTRNSGLATVIQFFTHPVTYVLVLALLITGFAKILRYEFNAADLVSVTVFTFVTTLIVYTFVLIFTSTAAQYTYGSTGALDENISQNLLAYVSTKLILFISFNLFEFAFLYLCLVFFHGIKKYINLEVIGYAAAIGILPILFDNIVTYVEIQQFPILSNIGAYYPIISFLFGFVALNYVIQEKGMLSKYFYGIVFFDVIVKAAYNFNAQISFAAWTGFLSYLLQLLIIYAAGRELTSKYNREELSQKENKNKSSCET